MQTSNETFPDRLAAFGPPLSGNHGKIGYLMEPAGDPTGCKVVKAPTEDWIALIRRGGCSFADKVRNMQLSGAIAVAIGDPEHSGWVTMYAPGKKSLAEAEHVLLSAWHTKFDGVFPD